jgi:hypothetical protein
MKVERVCERCGALFLADSKYIGRTRYGVRKRHAIYCSLSCANRRGRKIHEPNVTCAQCGKPFFRRPSHLTSKSGLYFCSRSCKEVAQRLGGMPEIHPSRYNNGSNYREIALRFYPAICVMCGYKKDSRILQVHHRDENRKNNEPGNLVVLCRNCHAEVHFGVSELVETFGIEPKSVGCKPAALAH